MASTEKQLEVYKLALELLANDHSGALRYLAKYHIYSDDCYKSPKEVEDTYLHVALNQLGEK